MGVNKIYDKVVASLSNKVDETLNNSFFSKPIVKYMGVAFVVLVVLIMLMSLFPSHDP